MYHSDVPALSRSMISGTRAGHNPVVDGIESDCSVKVVAAGFLSCTVSLFPFTIEKYCSGDTVKQCSLHSCPLILKTHRWICPVMCVTVVFSW